MSQAISWLTGADYTTVSSIMSEVRDWLELALMYLMYKKM